MSPDFLTSFDSDTKYQVFVEVDSKCAYAYLLKEQEIVGDVWLFNRGSSPEKEPWQEEDPSPPFQVPQQYCHLFPFGDEAVSDDFRVFFRRGSSPFSAVIYFRNMELAAIWDDAKPGKNRLIKDDCPAAIKMEDFEELDQAYHQEVH